MSLWPAFGPGLPGISARQAVGGQRCLGVVDALAREPERPGGGGHRHALHLDFPDHLVLHLQPDVATPGKPARRSELSSDTACRRLPHRIPDRTRWAFMT